MKKLVSRFYVLLSIAVLFIVLALGFLFTAKPASAEAALLDKEMMKTNVESFLQQVYTLDDATLEQYKQQGGFYQVLVESWTKDREILGDFKSFESTKIDDSKKDITDIVSQATFKNYSAEIIVSLDANTLEPKNYTCNIAYPLSQKMAQAGQNTALGLTVVFVMLIFLSLVIYLFGMIQKGSKKKLSSVDQGKAQPTPSLSSASEVHEDADEIAVVIAAALAAAEADSAGGPVKKGDFVVSKIRRSASYGSWKRA